MRKNTRKLKSIILLLFVWLTVVFIGISYQHFISKKIYEDSTRHLAEIYHQVNRSFGAFIEQNWGILNGWGDYISITGDKENELLSGFIEERQKYWGFSEFYFLADDGTCMTLDGEKDHMDLEEAGDILMRDGEPVMKGQVMSDGTAVTVFAVPVREGKYKSFGFNAIAITYTNKNLADSLDVETFSGNDKCFVIHDDGTVLLSTQSGGGVFSNYLTYLQAASDINEKELENIRNDWKSGTSRLVQCKIGDENQYILYQPVGYQDYMLLSVVPESVVNAGSMAVQKTTISVLALMFVLVGATVIAQIIYANRRRAYENAMELRYRERLFDVLSNSVDDIFIMLSIKNEHIDYVSPSVERLLGVSVQEAMENIRVLDECAVDCNMVIPREELENIPIQGSRYWESEYMHQGTGERRWYRITIYHMNIQDVDKYIIAMSDRTRERQMNQNLQEALTAAKSANEAKSNFLANMSHDIRTPMNAIVGFSILLEKEADNADKVREYTRKITASSQHLLSLINDVLDMSKIESGQTSLTLDCIDLSDMLEELDIILRPQANAKDQSFEVKTCGDLPEQIVGDKLRLSQILINLLSNAIKYTPANGKIEFIIKKLPQNTPHYVRLCFVVRDNGIGMSEEYQKNIFTPFSREVNSVTNKIQGTGLGMAITKNLIDLMGGVIHLESKQGAGSTFSVELSFALPEQTQEVDAQSGAAKKSLKMGNAPDNDVMRGLRFLVVEDNELNSEILTSLLEIEGAKHELAVNGLEAVEMFKASESGHYDMILMDIQMPVMNGYEATRLIRSSDHPDAKTIPIAAMTANTFAEDVRNAMEAGMDGHLAKPINIEEVRETVARLINRNK